MRSLVPSFVDFCSSLLREIRKLKLEHDQTVKNAQQVGTSPNVLSELKVLRQRKDELEMRMSALQETRRELMVQLEGLMKLLKVFTSLSIPHLCVWQCSVLILRKDIRAIRF